MLLFSAESSSVVKPERRRRMTGRADFTQEEWGLVLEGPPSAGMIVVTAQRGGSFRESIAMAKAYVEARRQHGESELLDEIVAARPERDHTRYHSVEELKQHGLQHLREAVELLERKATAEEVEDYRQFVLTLADKVANAHREGGEWSATPSGRRSTRSPRASATPAGSRLRQSRGTGPCSGEIWLGRPTNGLG
jgi:hypothetical protein